MPGVCSGGIGGAASDKVGRQRHMLSLIIIDFIDFIHGKVGGGRKFAAAAAWRWRRGRGEGPSWAQREIHRQIVTFGKFSDKL